MYEPFPLFKKKYFDFEKQEKEIIEENTNITNIKTTYNKEKNIRNAKEIKIIAFLSFFSLIISFGKNCFFDLLIYNYIFIVNFQKRFKSSDFKFISLAFIISIFFDISWLIIYCEVNLIILN